MRVVFMGTPDFAVPVLDALIEGGHQVVAAVTQPDKPKGRGKAVQMTPVKEKALSCGIEVCQPVKIKNNPEFLTYLEKLAPEVIVVVAFGQILPKEVLNLPVYGCINVHASLLPKYRGAAPIQWVIIDGEKETGITTMYMDEGLDTGDMLLKTVIPIEQEETGGSLHDKMCEAGGSLILETLKQLEEGTLKRIPQEGESCYAGMLDKNLGNIDWSMPAVSIERLIRGLNPWPSAYTVLNGRTLKIWKAQVSGKNFDGRYGEIVELKKDRIAVKTGEGTLEVIELQPEGKKRMAADAFMRGNAIETGMILKRKGE